MFFVTCYRRMVAKLTQVTTPKSGKVEIVKPVYVYASASRFVLYNAISGHWGVSLDRSGSVDSVPLPGTDKIYLSHWVFILENPLFVLTWRISLYNPFYRPEGDKN